MILLSAAILKGVKLAPASAPRCHAYIVWSDVATEWASCPLGAAYLGSLRRWEVEPFLQHARSSSHDSFCRYMVEKLHEVFPDLGASVRSLHHGFARWLEEQSIISTLRHRPEAQISLWGAITTLYDKQSYTKGEIATTLRGFGL